MSNLLKVELYKLRKSTSIYLITAICILMALLVVFGLSEYGVLTGKESLTIGFDFINQILFVLSFLLGINIVSDFNTGYFKDAICYGYKRKDIFLAKAIGFLLINLFIILLFPITLFLISMMKNGYGEAFNFQAFLYIFRVVVLISLISLASGTIVLAICFIGKSGGALLLGFMIVYFLNGILSMWDNSIVKSIVEKTIFGQVKIAILEKISFSQECQVVVVSLITMFIFLIIGIGVFKKVEIK